jgi:hypothetical protein
VKVNLRYDAEGPRRGRGRGRRLAAALALLLAGCTYGGGIDNPFTQRLTWFSYLGGSDIRAACAAGGPESYRIIYNGRYLEQLRSYELTRQGDGALLQVRVKEGPPNMARLIGGDLQGPWRWVRSIAMLSPAELAHFRALLDASGFLAGAPPGLVLHSNDFYWVASGCVEGKFHFAAWVAARGDFARVRFADFLLAHDQTGITLNPPRPVPAIDYSPVPPGNRDQRNRPENMRFRLEVGADGLLRVR